MANKSFSSDASSPNPDPSSVDVRVQQLVEELLDSHATPEVVCSPCPDLLPEVRNRWRQVCRLRADLDALFPPPDQPEPDALEGSALPKIPGYEVEAILGHGGMGIVYKARDLRLGRVVALKMLLAGPTAGMAERERFLREAEAMAELRHPNIVQVHGAGDHDGRLYFTMEYVGGGSLGQHLAGTPQPAREGAALLATLAAAVQVAHQGGIVHRDLKPANILLTADGTPKIADFGLARHFDNGSALTQSGTPVGTPSYMAPEQASGKSHSVSPATDIYALGAILYEMLTGRPPFRAETAVETHLQVISQEPVPPSRLNSKTPRDLETICLTCLQKAAERRYATAAALAEDLRRFERGDTITARPAGLLERTSKWVRRHPTWSALMAASLLLAVLLVGASFWLVVQRTNQRNAVEADLKELPELQASARWAEARAALERAEARLVGIGTADLGRRIAQARSDLDLVNRLDNIRLKRATRGELAFYKSQANDHYAEMFEREGLGKVYDPPQKVAAAVRASAVRGALVAALDDWAICAPDKDQRAWLLEVTRLADPDPDGWRDRILDAKAWNDAAALAEMSQTVPVAGRPVSLLLALGERLTMANRDSTPLLKRVHNEHPADFWANLILGNALLQAKPKEAEGYYRAALALRPQAAVGYCAVGDALRIQKTLPEAIEYYRKAITIEPKFARAHSDLGLALEAQGRLDEAIPCFREAVSYDPDYAWANHNLAKALLAKGTLKEAYDYSKQAIRLHPDNAEIRQYFTAILVRQGRALEACDAWQRALNVNNPAEHDAYFGYAELCLFLGRQDEYRHACLALLERFGQTDTPMIAERVGRACLLLPGTEDEQNMAVGLIQRAVAAKKSTPGWLHPYFLLAKGLADYRQGRFSSAISTMQGDAGKVMGPVPRLVMAMAKYKIGQKKEAQKTLAQAVLAYDWSPTIADSRDFWISHLVRREAEALIVPSLPAFLEGKYEPQDNDERLALLGVCQFKGLHATAAQLYTQCFAAEPWLVNDLKPGTRYLAARAAAQAGCGRGSDASGVNPTKQARLRTQALAWLRADLAARVRWLDSPSAAHREEVRKALTQWKEEPDLACVRDSAELDNLAPEEREQFLALWAEVAAVLARTKK
jgi:serine/threonine-protein kinase